MRYLLTCIDVFSKRAWAVPIRTKSVRDVTEAFEKIADERTCNMLQTDKGTEFLNSTFRAMLQRRSIHGRERGPEGGRRRAIQQDAEGKNVSLFHPRKQRRYVDVLDDLLHLYNNTRHRTIGMAPADVGPHDEDVVRDRLYPPKATLRRWKYDVGDRVRIAMQRRPFRKGYLGDWSVDIFEIAVRMPMMPVTYELRDLAGEIIKGRFYEPEIQKVRKSDGEHFDVDEILKTRRCGGKIEYLVSWKG